MSRLTGCVLIRKPQVPPFSGDPPMLRRMPVVAATLGAAVLLLCANSAMADGNLKKVNHIIIVMQENHSFDNYFGALAYAPGSPYHNGKGACAGTDHKCVDGLTCTV